MLRLWERLGDWILFLGLLLASVVFMVTANEPMLRGLRARALSVAGSVEARFAGIGRYVNALEENALLREENIRLSAEVARAREAVIENGSLRDLLALPDSVTGARVAARVIYKDITRERNTLVIDAGTQDGVEEGMAVINPTGIVGKVVLASAHYAEVMTFLNVDFFIPGKIQPHQSDGILRWSGEQRDRLEMDHVMRTEPVQKGQAVVTSGYSSIFRPGFSVGTVDSVLTVPGLPAWRVYVRPAVDLDELEHVFVLLERPDPERMQLQTPF